MRRTTGSFIALTLLLAPLIGCSHESHEVKAGGVTFVLSSNWHVRPPDRQERVLYARRNPGLFGMITKSYGTMWVQTDRGAGSGWNPQTAAHWQANANGFQHGIMHEPAETFTIDNGSHPSLCIASFLPDARTLSCAIVGTQLTAHFVGSAKGQDDVRDILHNLR